MAGIGFKIIDGIHPIVPVMLGDAVLSQQMADFLLTQGVYVIGFYFPLCRKEKRESGHRYLQRINRKILMSHFGFRKSITIIFLTHR
jgi:hypothetical protein